MTDWSGYLAKAGSKGPEVKAAWEAYSKATSLSAGFLAFVKWFQNMKAKLGDKFKQDPTNVISQLNAQTKLRTPDVATPSRPAGVPGKAV
jgi:hypothetical protein